MDPDKITAWISEQRFAPFLQRASGNRELANAIDPACGEWLTAHTQLIVLLKQRPITK